MTTKIIEKIKRKFMVTSDADFQILDLPENERYAFRLAALPTYEDHLVTFCTIGLSHLCTKGHFNAEDKLSDLRQEFIFTAYKDQVYDYDQNSYDHGLKEFLYKAANAFFEEMQITNRTFECFHFFNYNKVVNNTWNITGLITLEPKFEDDDIYLASDPGEIPIELLWLAPVTEIEGVYLMLNANEGSVAVNFLYEQFVEQDIDCYDLRRESIEIPSAYPQIVEYIANSNKSRTIT